MSALMTPRRAKRGRRTGRPAGAGGQSALFGAGSAPAVAPAPPAAAAVAVPAAEPTPTASAHRHGPTLDDLVAGAWEGLLAGAPADCLVCGAPMAPRHSAGAGIVGGRCDGCSASIG
jgi:hypothetical protein